MQFSKKYYLVSILALMMTIPSYAATYTEEQWCFDILKQYVKNDARFGWEDIGDAYMGKNLWRANLAQYETGFLINRAKTNDNNIFTNDKIFFARRNNIGTIITSSEYIISQFVTFGNSSNFKFPLPTKGKKLGEDYGKFRDQVIYTHHLFAPGHPDDGTFISCAFFRIVPAQWKTLNDVDPSNYKTNDIDASGFALLVWPSAPIEKNWHRFIVWKVNVPVKNYDDKPQMRLEMITVAHDTKSELFNEYETFPLQVQAMTDMDARDDVNMVQTRFLKYVKERTCLKIPHSSTMDLPSICNGTYKSLSKNNIIARTTESYISKISKYIWDLIIPSVSAKMDPLTAEEIREHGVTSTTIPQWMYINPEFRFDLREKLDVIGNPVLTSYVLQAVTEWWEIIINNKQLQWEKLTADENTFINCNINYKTRTEIISNWLENLDPKKFDITNITYSDPRIGDCILPFPDARNRMKIIPWSFPINQYNAARLSNNTWEIDRLNKELQIDTRDVKPSKLWWLNFYNPIYNEMSRITLGIILLISGCITIIWIIRSRKKSESVKK